ncbi:DUF5103 domain-containing protein [Mucilaginibacter gynuensis]
MRKLTATILFLFIVITAFAQPYDNIDYHHEIKSIECYKEGKQGSLPMINLGSDEKIVIGFDDLSAQTRNFYYTLEHCDANWNSSNLSPAEYLQSFTEDRILNYKYSSGTYRKYIHYEVSFPNSNIIPKYAGNYILKVYEDGDQKNIIFTRRIYVLNTRINVGATIVPSNNVATRQTNQKLNFQVDYGTLRVQNPGTDIRVFVMQNARSEIGIMNMKPTYIRGSQLIYNDVNINDMPGRNEFRYFDMRTLKAGAPHIAHITRDTANVVELLRDENRANANYSFQYDNNGNFYILNQDGADARVDADYAHVSFNLNANKTSAEGSVYVVGRFNNYRLTESNKLNYDAASGRFFTTLFLKQGVYDYEYIWVDRNKKADDVPLEGSHYETENDYQLLVYYRPPGARWEELAGFQQVNTGKK